MFLKTLFSWLLSTIGFFILLAGVGLFIFSFFVNALNEDDFNRLADEKIDSMIDNNLAKLKSEQGIVEIKEEQKPQLIEFCKTQSANNPLCDPDFLSGKITQDDALKRNIKSQIDIKNSEGTRSMIEMINQAKQINPFVYGIILFVFGSLIILVGKSFSITQTLIAVGYEGAFASVIAAVNFKILPSILEKISSVKIIGTSAEAEMSKIMPDIFLEWFKPALDNAFMASLILTGIFAVVYVIALLIKKSSENELVSVQ